MDNRIFIIFFGLLSVITLQSCTEMMCILSGYKPSEIKNNCGTPEPGTRLTPRCNLILKHADRYSVNPDSVFNSKKNLLNLIKPNVRYIEDIEILVDTAFIPVRLYCNVPERRRNGLSVLVYYHGGGFIWGSVEIFDRLCRKLAKETETILVSVDYRLAPDYPFPFAVNDCYTALKWTERNIDDYGGDTGKIIVMGESAGGNLAAVMALMSYDSCGPDIEAQIIVCGATTFEETIYPSRQYFMLEGKSYLVSKDFINKCKSAYIPDNIDITHPYISPLNARLDKEMPPVLFITAQVDPLRDEGKEYAMRMKNAGINVV
ncbi:MAG TPA: hypothetical protein DEQ09_13015, partial [Bacteroidales bacterium]|nr:hypothetical protein [Bacteroidales bacterium]